MQTILLITLGLVAICSATIPFTSNDVNVLARIYDNYTQLYRPATLKTIVDNNSTTLEKYRFYFTSQEYENIDKNSIILLYVNVLERTVIYHSNPNIETIGTHYLYQLNPQDNKTIIEIELINIQDRLFRNVQQPNQYFYLKSFENLIYLNQEPVQPYYELTFLVNRTNTIQTPLLSYLDRSIGYIPRYFLNLPTLNNVEQGQFIAYADLTNNQTYPIVLKAVELIVKDFASNQGSIDYLRMNHPDIFNNSTEDNDDEKEIHTYVYQLTSPIPIILPSQSIKSVQFLERNLTIVPYLSLSIVFSPMNITGNVIKTYNLTSMNNYLPTGRMIYHDQGRFTGEIILPDLIQNETYILSTDVDSDVIYRRQVRLVETNKIDINSLTYDVDYKFENNKQFDIEIQLYETFNLFKNYQFEKISDSLINVNDGLEGVLVVPQQGDLTVSYRVTFSK